MNKILRYFLLSFLAIVATGTYAKRTVTIDFDNDYQKIFPTLKGVSSGSGDSYVADGDFTDNTYSPEIDGITLAVSAADEGVNTPNRIWTSSPRLRMYSGALVVACTSGEIIEKIEFNASKFDVTAETGTLTDQVWTDGGQTTFIAVFRVTKNTQIKSMTVTLRGLDENPGEDNPDTPSDPDDPFSKFNITSGSITDNGNQLLVEFAGKITDMDVRGKFTFDFENDLCTGCTVSVTFPSAELAQAAYQDAVSQGETATIDGNTVSTNVSEGIVGLSKIAIKSMMKVLIDKEAGGIGTIDSPLTPNYANIYAGSLEKDASTEEDVYVKGKIASIKYEFSAQYGTATFFISADGQNDYTFQCYSVNYLENKPWVEGNTQIKVGDEVVICGKLVNYKGTTPETVSKKAYVYSLNGKTKEEGSTPEPQPEVKQVTIADFNAVPESNDVWYQLTGVVKNLKDGDQYGNFDLEDETASVYVYGLLAEKGGAKKKFQELAAAKGIQNGSKITIIGNRGSYNDKIEVMNAYFVSIEEAAAEGMAWDFTQWSAETVANLKADAAASASAGWSDIEKADATEPTEASKDNCFWSVAEPNEDGSLSANGTVIKELKGLKWNSNYSTKRSLAIAVNYASTSLGDYAGGAYLWLGGGKKKIPCFTIPGVKAGSTVTMEVESHKPSEGRGVELYTGLDADGLVDAATKIGDTFAPTAKEAHSWTIENDCDVIVYNTNGCHIYTLKIEEGTASINTVKAAAQNGAIYNLAGQKVGKDYKGIVIMNGKKFVVK